MRGPLTTPRRDRRGPPVTPPRPLPFADLLACLKGSSDRERAVELGVSRRQIVRYKAQRNLSVDQADVLANRAGYHPAEVWPEWIEESA